MGKHLIMRKLVTVTLYSCVAALCGFVLYYLFFALVPVFGGHNGFSRAILGYISKLLIILYFIIFFILKYVSKKNTINKITIYFGLLLLILSTFYFIKFPTYKEPIEYSLYHTPYREFSTASIDYYLIIFSFSAALISVGLLYKSKLQKVLTLANLLCIYGACIILITLIFRISYPIIKEDYSYISNPEMNYIVLKYSDYLMFFTIGTLIFSLGLALRFFHNKNLEKLR